MTRYPFRHAVNEFMDAYRGVYADTTYRELDRRFRRIGRILEDLRSSGEVSTTDPARMTPEDVKAFAVYLRTISKVRPASLQHDVGTLQTICMYFGNDCVRFARAKYPLAFPVQGKSRGSVIERPEFDRIVSYADRCDGADLRDAAAVLLCLGSGLRPCEIREARVSDLDIGASTMYVRRPKGGDSWGMNRTVPVRPEVRSVLARYVLGRAPDSYLFPSPKGGRVSENSLGVWRSNVCARCGVSFDYRKCRRTYGQYLLDEGYSLEDVSVLLGHSNETTTSVYYGRRRPERVVQSVLSGWESGAVSDMGDCDITIGDVDENAGAREGI